MPETDPQSRAVVEQMYIDERGHAEWAEEAGGTPLPQPVRYAMAASSKLLTVGAYWI
jgi:ubiquinone biosynthesis monooxygenase Coq7